MTTKTKVDLGIVQETLLITLWARAAELQQTDPLLALLLFSIHKKFTLDIQQVNYPH